MAEEFPTIPLYQVAGNCDEYRYFSPGPMILEQTIGGAKFYLTHGHRHHVKSGLWSLLQDARKAGVNAVLYGHTHVADCHREEDGLWVLNPGACGYGAGSAGIIELENGSIKDAYIIDQRKLEEML